MEQTVNEIQNDEMKMNENEGDMLIINSTPNYGFVFMDSISFDDQEFFGEDLISFRISKIVGWTGETFGTNNEGDFNTKHYIESCVAGIQIFYKNAFTGEEVSPGEYKGTKATMKKEFVLQSTEFITDFHVEFSQQNHYFLDAIEFVTNKERVFRIGGTGGESKNTKLKGKGLVIVGVFGGYKDYLYNCGVYHLPRKHLMTVMYSGLFYLSFYLKKNTEKQKELLENIKQYKLEDQVIIKMCSLPKYTFLSVLKYLN